MDTIEAITTRQSVGRLGEPAPPQDVLDLALRCAMAAPDHGRLRPARFIIVRGAARERIGRMFAGVLRKRQPDAPQDELDRAASKAMRAPMLIIAACSPQEGKIPKIEQILSVGASVENLLLALHAQGYGAMWRTGEPAYDSDVKRELGLGPDDHIVGFVYAGTKLAVPPLHPRSEPPDAVRYFD